jgi:hypothetical protein
MTDRTLSLFFSGYILRFFIIPESCETCMPQVKVRGPFDELKLTGKNRSQPSAFFHLGSRQSLAPPSAFLFWKIVERTFGDLKRTKTLHQLDADCRRKAVPRSSRMEHFAFLVVADDQRIEILVTGRESGDDQFLTLVDARLLPCPGAQTRLVGGVPSLGDETF